MASIVCPYCPLNDLAQIIYKTPTIKMKGSAPRYWELAGSRLSVDKLDLINLFELLEKLGWGEDLDLTVRS